MKTANKHSKTCRRTSSLYRWGINEAILDGLSQWGPFFMWFKRKTKKEKGKSNNNTKSKKNQNKTKII